MTTPKVLFYDIETSPLVSYTWGTFQQNVIKVKEEWQLLSVAWKWQGDRYVNCATSEWDEGTAGSDEGLAQTIRDLFDEADIVVAHNGNRFDQPKSRARMSYWHIDPPGSFKQVDTLSVARRNFKFTSNRLGELGEFLGCGRKAETGGFSTWEDCMAGDPKAWAKMVKYNKQDVKLLEAVYDRLLPWDTTHPNMAMFSDRPAACPKCATEGSLIVHGWRYYQVTKRCQYQCKSCRSIVYGRHIVKDDAYHVG